MSVIKGGDVVCGAIMSMYIPGCRYSIYVHGFMG